jgi:hypothetical protein
MQLLATRNITPPNTSSSAIAGSTATIMTSEPRPARTYGLSALQSGRSTHDRWWSPPSVRASAPELWPKSGKYQAASVGTCHADDRFSCAFV